MAQMDDLDALDDLGSLDDLDGLDDLDDLSFDSAPAAIAAGPPAPASPAPASPAPASPAPAPAANPMASGLGAVLQDLFDRRNFQQILQIAENQKQALQQDPQALAIVRSAQQQQESETYVQAFLKAAREAGTLGNQEEMESNLAKARSLGPQHPDVLAFVAPAPAAPAPAAPAPAAPAPAAVSSPAPAAPPLPEEEDMFSFASDDDPMLFGNATDGAVSDLESLDQELSAPPAASPSPAALPPAVAQAPQQPAVTDAPAPGGDFDLDDFSFSEDLTTPASPDGEAAFEASQIPQPTAPAAPTVAEFAPAAAGEEGGARIEGLLSEGQEIFDRGDYQAAIDVWSRIFLMDIDNAEASRRIEEARSKKAELERQAEEVFHEGVGHIEGNALEEAKEAFRRVLEVQPNHSLAREYLDQLEAGQVPSIQKAAAAAGADDLIEADSSSADGEAHQSMEAAVRRDRVVVVKKTDKRLVALGALVLVLVVGGGGFLATHWNDFFPNQDDAPAPGGRQVDPLDRATKMHEAGQTENAIIVLERIPESDPAWENAQAVIAQWKALVETPPEEVATGPSEEQRRRYNVLLGAARSAHGEGHFIQARKYFDRASKVLPLDASDQGLRLEAERILEPLKNEIEGFNAGEYSTILPTLWRKRDDEPENHDIETLIVDSYYNLALTDLQRSNPSGAASKIKEALEVRPESRDLQRLHLFAQTYSKRQPDLLFRIFIKYLPSRS